MGAAFGAGRWRRVRNGLFLLLLLTALGCGSPTVRGKITYKGQALGDGMVVFTVPGKGSVRSEIGEDGSYTISKCPTGTATITVETTSAKPVVVRDPTAARSVGKRPPQGAIPKGVDASFYQGGQQKGKYVPIPDKYKDPAKSGLEYTIQSGSHEYNIELQ